MCCVFSTAMFLSWFDLFLVVLIWFGLWGCLRRNLHCLWVWGGNLFVLLVLFWFDSVCLLRFVCLLLRCFVDSVEYVVCLFGLKYLLCAVSLWFIVWMWWYLGFDLCFFVLCCSLTVLVGVYCFDALGGCLMSFVGDWGGWYYCLLIYHLLLSFGLMGGFAVLFVNLVYR